ncbi:MAG: M1 family metallopeptidase [Cyclobacteriaceae bacterium]
MKKGLIFFLLVLPVLSYGQGNWEGKFEQLGHLLPSPNAYRTAAGTPGSAYWQQQADYKIEAELNDENQTLAGNETITYYNNSPHDLSYLWLQLDQNIRNENSDTPKTKSSSISSTMSGKEVEEIIGNNIYTGGFNINEVSTAGKTLSYSINKTMMRVDLPEPLKAGSQFSFDVGWSYHINDRMMDDGRGGYEYFPEEDNYIYAIAQWFPRMSAYTDKEGWQNKQYLGDGEFALTFGNYDVSLTVPADHLVAATGELQNPENTLSPLEYSRFQMARNTFDTPVIIRSEEEASLIEKTRALEKKQWRFKANNVRDFALTSSRKFIWDAMAVGFGERSVMAMSLYPKEGNPLWEEESTMAVANTLKTYSKFTFDYPYPVATSVHTADIGMEYPMICFNYGRPIKGNYSRRTREVMIDVIIHEVGHNYFPMIVNSDERQWEWMDEGLNTFLENQTLFEHYPEFDISWGTPKGVVPYMRGSKERQRPMMTNPEQLVNAGFTSYSKPSAALHILRETVMGPELFDFAFKHYANTWAFKNPEPADFFRSMENASAVDLDWFWKGWFYGTDRVNIAIDNVTWYRIKKYNSKSEEASSRKPNNILLRRFADEPEIFDVTYTHPNEYGEFRNQVDDKAIRKANENMNFYEVSFKNKGGLVIPVILEWQFEDETKEVQVLPAEIWRKNEREFTKVFRKEKRVMGLTIDPKEETADTDVSDNVWPRAEKFSKFDRYKRSR